MTDPMLKNVLERAIQSEENSYRLYSQLSQRVERPETKKLLQGLAAQELGHKKLLEGVDLESIGTAKPVKLPEEKTLSDFLEPTPISADSTIQDVILFAIRKEQSAYEFYKRMSEYAPTAQIKALFERLTGEELKHKENLESLYEEMFMREM
jgi:rubrerythrin